MSIHAESLREEDRKSTLIPVETLPSWLVISCSFYRKIMYILGEQPITEIFTPSSGTRIASVRSLSMIVNEGEDCADLVEAKCRYWTCTITKPYIFSYVENLYTRFCSLIKPQPYFRDPLWTFKYHPGRFKIYGTIFIYRLNLWLLILEVEFLCTLGINTT